jgi:hypothetical protein
MSFIDNFIEKIEAQTDAPKLFLRSAAYYLVSSTLGEYFNNELVPRGVKRPNIWIILSSLPGRMRRSTVQNIVTNIYSEVIGELAPSTIWEDGSPEGIIDAVEEGIDFYTLQSTELGGVLAKCKKNDSYAHGLFTLWSKLYYGESAVQHFSKKSNSKSLRVLPSGLYVTMMAGLQEPKLYFDETMLRQGLLRRLIIAYIPKAEKWMEPINPNRLGFNLDEHIRILKEKREALIQKPSIPVTLDPDATKIINNYSRVNDEALDAFPDVVALYRQTYWEHLLKIATLHAIDETPNREPIIITSKEVQKAMNYIIEYSVNIEPEILKLGTEGERAKSRETDFQKILRMIEQSKDDYGFITISDIIKKTNWTADETMKVLNSMIEGEMIDSHWIQYGKTKVHVAYVIHGEMPEWVEAHLTKPRDRIREEE